jgi:hypothetical protein
MDIPTEAPPFLIFERGTLDQVRVSRVLYRAVEWVTLRHWALDPGRGWTVTHTISLCPDEVASVAVALATHRARKKRSR